MLPTTKNRRFTFSDLQIYGAIFIKHTRLMALLLMLGLLCGLAYFEYVVPVYYSRGQVEVVETKPIVDSADDYFVDTGLHQVRLAIDKPKVKARARKKLGITNEQAKRQPIRKVSIESSGERVPRSLSMQGYKPDPVLYVRTQAISYELARDWLPTLIESYLEIRDEERLKKHEDRIRAFSQDIVAMNDRADAFRQKKERMLEELRVFETNRQWESLSNLPKQIASVEDQTEAVEQLKERLSQPDLTDVDKLSILTQLDHGTGLRVGDVLDIDRSVEAVPGTPPLGVLPGGIGRQPSKKQQPVGLKPANRNSDRVVVLPSVLARPALEWEALDRERQVLAAQRQELLNTFLPGHRDVRAVTEQLERVQGQLSNQLNNGLQRLELMHQSKLAAKQDLERKLPTYREVSTRLDRIKREIEQFDAQRLNWTKAAEKMAKELAQLDFVSDRDSLEVRFNGMTHLSDWPQSPNRKKLAVSALGLGVGLALSLVVLVEYLDNTVSMHEQLQDDLGLEGLGVIPKYRRGAVVNLPYDGSSDEGMSSIAETFRVVRTNLITNKEQENPRQVIMVTSSIPREGKSMVSSNLAATFAGLGEKTLIIDADVRRGKLHQSVGTTREPGLSEVLNGTSELAEGIRQTGIDNLSIFPCGERVKNASAIMGGPKFKQLLNGLRKEYDRIIVDTPPVLGISETCAVLPHVDGVVMVVWCGYTPLTQVQSAVESLRHNGANFYGCILNRLDLNDAVNYQHYYYYSSYYYQAYKPDELPPELEADLRRSATGGTTKPDDKNSEADKDA